MRIKAICCIIALTIMCVGCSKTESSWKRAKEANTIEAYEAFLKEAPESSHVSDAQERIRILLRQGAAAAPVLFDPHTPLVKGQEVRAFGLVEYENPEEDYGVSRASARVKIANGEFSLLLDMRGEEMARTMDGKSIEFRGILTGEATYDMTATLSSMTSGTISKVSRVPEIKVEEFKFPAAQEKAAIPLVDNGDGTITDNKTGLVWQKGDDGHARTWNEAMKYAKSMSLAGQTDWRLPTRDELVSLWQDAGRKKKLRKTYFPGMKLSAYWASTPDKEDWAGVVGFDASPNPMAFNDTQPKSDSYYARCVRSGNGTGRPVK